MSAGSGGGRAALSTPPQAVGAPQRRNGAVAQEKGQVHQHGQHREVRDPGGGKLCSEPGRAEHKQEQRIDKRHRRVEKGELGRPAQRRRAQAFEPGAQHRVGPQRQRIKQRKLRFRHKQQRQDGGGRVLAQGRTGAVFLQRRQQQEAGQHRRGIGAEPQRAAHKQHNDAERRQHPAQRDAAALRVGHARLPLFLPKYCPYYTMERSEMV